MKKIVLKASSGGDIAEGLQALISEHEGSGNVIVIPKGEYVISKTVILKSGIKISGSGKNKTRLIPNENTKDKMFTNGDYINGNSGIGIYNLVVEGKSMSKQKPADEKRLSLRYFFYFKKVLDVELLDIQVLECRQTALHFSSCTNVFISNLLADGMGWSGISTLGTNNIRVEKSTIIHSGKDIRRSAIHLDGGNGAYLSCEIQHCTGNGIMLDSKFATFSNAIVDSKCTHCLRGISLSGDHANLLSNVLIKNTEVANSKIGIMISNSKNVFIDKSSIHDIKEVGVLMQGKFGGCEVVVNECVFEKNETDIKEIDQSAGNYFINNSVTTKSKTSKSLADNLITNVAIVDSYVGSCSVCGISSEFVYSGGSVRESYRCTNCDASLRNRDQAHTLLNLYGDDLGTIKKLSENTQFKKLKIFEPGVIGPFRKYFRKLPHYLQSFYWTDIPFGAEKEGIVNEDLQQLTLKSDTFDLVITSDIFEHIRKPFLAHKEIYRVLKNGGRHVFTIPIQYPFPKETVYRVDTSGEEDIHILPPVYHGNGAGGKSLVYTDFGSDMIVELNTIGFETEIVQAEKKHKLRSKNITFVCTKK